MDSFAELKQLVQEHALEFGKFTLASGKEASFYLDCRKVTLHARGAALIAEAMLNRLQDNLPQAVGGMAIGADPITGAVITLAGQTQVPIKGFIVRKEAKQHGKGQAVEGPVKPGESCVILEDVVTTGGSSLAAIEKAEEFGLKVQGVLALVDRLEGGQELLAERGYPLDSLFTVRDFGIEAE